MPAPSDLQQRCRRLHALYCARTGYDLSYNMTREMKWADWLRFGDYQWTEDDLSRTIAYLAREISEKNKGRSGRNEGCLKFHNLVGQPDLFEEDLAQARKVMRPLKKPAPAPAPAPDPATAPAEATPAAEVTAAKALEDFKQLFGSSDK